MQSARFRVENCFETFVTTLKLGSRITATNSSSKILIKIFLPKTVSMKHTNNISSLSNKTADSGYHGISSAIEDKLP